MNYFATKVTRKVATLLVPLLSASTLIGTGFALWTFTVSEIDGNNLTSFTVNVKPASENLGKVIVNSFNETDYSNYRLIFEGGNELEVADENYGVSFYPEIDCEVINIPYYADGYDLLLELSIENGDSFTCPGNHGEYIGDSSISSNIHSLSDMIEIRGFELFNSDGTVKASTEEGKKYMHFSPSDLSYDANSEFGTLDNLYLNPLFHWKVEKPTNTDAYGTFIQEIENCTCQVVINIRLIAGGILNA